MYDLLLKNGTIYDRTGAPGYLAHVGVVQGRIVPLGNPSVEASQMCQVWRLLESREVTVESQLLRSLSPPRT